MGALQDLPFGQKIDYVDNPFWSAMQIKAKLFQNKEAAPIMDTDYGRVLLFVNLTMDPDNRD